MKWQDGVPFTAKDVAYTYNAIIKYGLSNFGAAMTGIKNAVATDDTTVVINCKYPKADILAMWCPIIPEHIWGTFTKWNDFERFVNKPPVIGTGPFQVVEFKKGEYVRAEANPDYWRGKPKVDEIVFQYYTNQSNMVQDVKSGAIQLAENIPPGQMPLLRGAANLEAGAHKIKAFDELAFNTYDGPSLGNPVLKDAAFRRALAWAVDRDKIVKMAYYGYAEPGTTIFQPNFYDPKLDWHYEPTADEKYGFALDKAKAMLDAAGYKLDAQGRRLDKQGKPIALRLLARQQAPSSQIAGKLITNWFTDLGLKITLSVVDNGVVIDKLYNYEGKTYEPDYDMFLWGWMPSGSDPTRVVGYFTSDQIENNNDCCWSNKTYDALFEEQERQLDPQKRKELVWQAEKLFYDEAPYIVLAYPSQLEAWDKTNWTGWTPTPSDGGSVALVGDNIDNYLKVHPATAEAASGGSSRTGALIAVITAVVVIAAIAAVLLRHRGGKAEEA